MSKTDKKLKTGLRRVHGSLRAANQWIRLHKGLMAGVLAGLLAVVIVGTVVRHHRAPDWKVIDQVEAKVGVAPTLAELQQRAAQAPKDAAAQLELGHAYFDQGQHAAALRSYELALNLDPSRASERVVKNAVACFGTAEQPLAMNLLTRHKLVSAEADLRAKVADRRQPVRTGAVATLDRLGLAQRGDWQSMWLTDLRETSCDTRRNAVEKLGQFGDKRTIAAIKAAKKKDEANTRWWQFSCLGGRADDAEKKIASR